MTEVGQKPRQRGSKKLVGLGLLAGAVLIFAGCSEIDTNLVIEDDLSGQRVMDVYISDSDLEDNVDATPEELDAVAEANLPDSLTYTPFAAVDGGVQAQFNLEFSDPDDYLGKVESLIATGDLDIEPTVTMQIADSLFSQGVLVEENFTSKDLLYFYTQALIDEGIVSESDRSDVFSSRDTVVTVGGEEHETYSEIYLDTIEATGMDSVSMVTTHEGGQWQRTFTLTMDSDTYEEMADIVDDYFAESTPSEAAISESSESWEVTWEVAFPAMTAEELTKATDDLLLTDNAVFETESTAISGLFGTQLSITDNADCSQICRYPDSAIMEYLDLGQGSSATDVDGEDTDFFEDIMEFAADGQTIELDQYYPLDGIEVGLAFGFTGSATLAVNLLVPSDVADESDENIRTVLETENGAIQLKVSGSDDWTSYETVLSAGSPGELSALLEEYLPGSFLEYGEESGLFKRELYGTLHLDLYERIGEPAIAEGASYAVSLPMLHSFKQSVSITETDSAYDELKGHDEDLDGFLDALEELEGMFGEEEVASPSSMYSQPVERGSAEAVTIHFAASGWTLTGLIIVGVIILLVVAAAVVLFLNRKKIKARRDAAKARKAEALALQQSQMPTAMGAPVPQGSYQQPPPDAGVDARYAGGSELGSQVQVPPPSMPPPDPNQPLPPPGVNGVPWPTAEQPPTEQPPPEGYSEGSLM